MDLVLQINTFAFCSFFSRKKIENLINTTERHIVIGSDCHDLRNRKSYFGKACELINKNWGKDFLDDVCCISENIIANKSIEQLLERI